VISSDWSVVSSSFLAWIQITVLPIRDLVKFNPSLTARLGPPRGAERPFEDYKRAKHRASSTKHH
jgi:hypothetical protein